MSLWTLLQSVLLVANALAVLNEERFLEPKNLSQSAITSGYVSAHGFKGQLIGLIYAASYLRMPLLAANAIVIFVKVLFGYREKERVKADFARLWKRAQNPGIEIVSSSHS